MTIRDKVRRQKASLAPPRALYFLIMRNVAFAVAAAGLLGVAATAQAPQAPAAAAKAPVKMAASHVRAGPDTSGPSIEAQNKLVAQYCSGCHSERGKAGGLVLAGFDAAKVEANAETAEKMIRKLRAGMMPPPTARHPEGHARRQFPGPRLPGRRRVRDPRVDAQRAARRHLRPLFDADDGHHRASGRVGGRRARRAARRQSRDERDGLRPEQRAERP